MKAINPHKTNVSVSEYLVLTLNERINARHNSIEGIEDINLGGFRTAYDQLFRLTADMWYYASTVTKRAATPHLAAMTYPCG